MTARFTTCSYFVTSQNTDLFVSGELVRWELDTADVSGAQVFLGMFQTIVSGHAFHLGYDADGD